MNPSIKCLTPQRKERFLDILKNRKDAERTYMLYHLMLVTGLRLSEVLSLDVEHASRAKLELKVYFCDVQSECMKKLAYGKALFLYIQRYIWRMR